MAAVQRQKRNTGFERAKHSGDERQSEPAQIGYRYAYFAAVPKQPLRDRITPPVQPVIGEFDAVFLDRQFVTAQQDLLGETLQKPCNHYMTRFA